MKFLLGTKKHMTQYFSEDGKVYPATLIASGTLTVTQIKSKERDGYSALQVGFGNRKASRISKAVKGHLGDKGSFSVIREARVEESDVADMTPGTVLELDRFAVGDVVNVTAKTKGKGFQGVVKRHGFGGGPRTHGQKHSEREPGSIGGGLRTRVPKGMRMAGRMGGDTVTVQNLKVLHVDKEEGTLLVSGAVPGRRGTVVAIKTVK